MSESEKVHPMVPVPEAIRTVLRETARVLLNPKAKTYGYITISTSAPASDILGTVLAEDVRMKEPGYPPYNASIMDGYAIQTAEFGQSAPIDPWTHHVADRVYAGDEQGPKSVAPKSDGLPSAYYITTGAVVPASYDSVVPIEECIVSDEKDNIKIQTSAKIAVNEWIRPVGCDIPAGSIVMQKGDAIDPVALGLLKQSGADSIVAKRPLVVGVLSTGNELILGSKDNGKPGKIPDVNRPILLNLLSTFGNCCRPLDLGNQRDDDVHAMANTIDQALDKCDVIISTGGISMGETDIVEQVLVEHCGGKLHFGRLHMKPGKPTTFVTIPKDDAVRIVFAMPGNPVSATVCTQLLVRPCLDLLFHGLSEDYVKGDKLPEEYIDRIMENALVHPEIDAKLLHDINLDHERPEYHRVTIHRLIDGSYGVATTGNQRSSRLLSCRNAQALLALPVGSPSKPQALQGEKYPVLSLGDLRSYDQLKLKDAVHFKKRGRQVKVAVVELVSSGKEHLSKLDDTCTRIQDSLSGSKSGNAAIVSKKTFSDVSMENLYAEIVACNGADLVVLSFVTFEGSFRYHLDVTTAISNRLTKPAKTLALQARQGAAAEDPKAALFEVVVGYAPEEHGAMVICLPDIGVSGGLGNVRGLLKHALNVARGKPHNHHHTHHGHDHGKPQ